MHFFVQRVVFISAPCRCSSGELHLSAASSFCFQLRMQEDCVSRTQRGRRGRCLVSWVKTWKRFLFARSLSIGPILLVLFESNRWQMARWEKRSLVFIQKLSFWLIFCMMTLIELGRGWWWYRWMKPNLGLTAATVCHKCTKFRKSKWCSVNQCCWWWWWFCWVYACQANNTSNVMQPYDVSLMINPPDVTPVTLLLEGSNVGRGDKWYLPFTHVFLYHMKQSLSEV